MESSENFATDTRIISIFPLPSTVLFPQTLLPLHIFEPRYREMVKNSLEKKQWIGMALLQPGWEDSYFENPPIEPICGAGEIYKWDLLEDGKYNMVLRGTRKFRIIREIKGTVFRQAEAQELDDINDRPVDEQNDPEIKILMDLIREYIQPLPSDSLQKSGFSLSDCKTIGHLADMIIYFSDLSAQNKQTFLLELDVNKRLKSLLSFLEEQTTLLRRSKFFSKKGVDFRMN